MKNCNCGGRPFLQRSENYFNLKTVYRYICENCGKHTQLCDDTHDAFKEWETLNPDIPRIEKIEMPELSPEEIKDIRKFNARLNRLPFATQRALKPCPFCGGEAKIDIVEKGVKSIIYCTTPECGFMRHSFNNGDTDENAALRLTTAWNRRAEE